MKKSIFIMIMLILLACSLLLMGCDGDEDSNTPEKTDPAFFEGTWVAMNADNNGMPTFTITKTGDEYTFECHVPMPVINSPAKATGKFDYKAKGLGPDDYFLREMKAGDTADPDESFTAGNAALASQIGAFNNILATLKPNSAKTQFTFTSTNVLARSFFGGFGAYIKQAE